MHITNEQEEKFNVLCRTYHYASVLEYLCDLVDSFDEEELTILRLYNRLDAIRAIRNELKIGLLLAKELVDHIQGVRT